MALLGYPVNYETEFNYNSAFNIKAVAGRTPVLDYFAKSSFFLNSPGYFAVIFYYHPVFSDLLALK